MGTRGTSTDPVRMTEAGSPKLGLRFDRGRTELVLDAPIVLPHGVRLDAMRTELAPLEGRLSLTEGWRAFRHRRSTLVAATVSIGVRELAAMIGREVALETQVIALGSGSISLAMLGEAVALGADLAWGFDGEDLLLVVSDARAVPEAPRPALALVHDLAATAGATFDRARGLLRIARPLHAVLASALLPAGLRLPRVTGLAHRAFVEGDRVVLTADRAPGGVPEASRPALERARASAESIAACIDGGPEPEDGGTLATAARELADALAAEPTSLARIASAADAYAARERHAALASRALLLAAERLATVGARCAPLAIAAIERAGLTASASLARAIELAARDAGPDARKLPWEQLARLLDGGGPAVLRARALALEQTDRGRDTLAAFAEAARLTPDDRVVAAGLGRSLRALERFDEAISAFDRAGLLSVGDDAAEAKLCAARAALAAGHAEAAIARFTAILREHDASVIALAAHGELSRALAGRDLAAAIAIDRTLPALTDALGALYAGESSSALRWAIARALKAGDAELARALGRALARARGDDREIASLEGEIAEVEARALASTDVATLRARADAMRKAGDHGEAARALIEVFAQTKDAAILRAAIELADRARDVSIRLAVFDRALALLPAGAARDAIAARR